MIALTILGVRHALPALTTHIAATLRSPRLWGCSCRPPAEVDGSTAAWSLRHSLTATLDSRSRNIWIVPILTIHHIVLDIVTPLVRNICIEAIGNTNSMAAAGGRLVLKSSQTGPT